MPLSTADLKFKLSVKTGAAGNSVAQPLPSTSLGKFISTTEWAGGVLHDLLDVVTSEENAANEAEYRCVFIHNAHPSLALGSPVIWIEAELASGASGAIGVDPTAASTVGSASAQAVEAADENTPPIGVEFSAPTTKGTGLSIGTIPAGQCKAIWLRRTAANSATINDDSFTIRVEGDSEGWVIGVSRKAIWKDEASWGMDFDVLEVRPCLVRDGSMQVLSG